MERLRIVEDIKSTGKQSHQQRRRNLVTRPCLPMPRHEQQGHITSCYRKFRRLVDKGICLSALCAIKYVLLFNVYENRRRFHF